MKLNRDMKKRIGITVLFCNIFFAVQAQEKIDARIKEVYGEYTNEMVLNDPDLLKALNDLLQNRVKIINATLEPDEKFEKLSQIDLLNKYNPNLTRDLVFDPSNFNVLKYKLNFFSNTLSFVYRIDNTNYLIVIEPQSFK